MSCPSGIDVVDAEQAAGRSDEDPVALGTSARLAAPSRSAASSAADAWTSEYCAQVISAACVSGRPRPGMSLAAPVGKLLKASARRNGRLELCGDVDGYRQQAEKLVGALRGCARAILSTPTHAHGRLGWSGVVGQVLRHL